MDIFQIISGVLGLVTVLLGVHLAKIKAVVKEFAEVAEAIEKAAEDDKISKEELKKIVKEGKEFIAAIKALFR